MNRSLLLKYGRVVIASAIVGASVLSATPAFALDTTPLSTQMGMGSSGAQVSRLQTFLAMEPAIYPAGLVTGYYGAFTARAVTQFQVHFGLPQVGRVGPLTLAAMNGVIATGRPLDVSAPLITVSSVQPGTTEATVSWGTSEVAHGVVYYSTNPLTMSEVSRSFTQPTISGTAVAVSDAASTQGAVLNNLSRATTYYYVIEAIDASGNTSVTLQRTFVTR